MPPGATASRPRRSSIQTMSIPVNRAFTPRPEEVAWAEQVIAAFAADPRAGVVKIDGKMIDKPHERAAQKIMAMVNRSEVAGAV